MRSASYAGAKKSKWPYFLQGAVGAVIFLLIAAVIYCMLLAAAWLYKHPVQDVAIKGSLVNVDKGRMQLIVQKNLYQQSWLSLPVKNLRAQLLAMPWVAGVSIQRSWPWRLQITINEQVAVARWGQTDYLTSSGEVIVPTQTSSVAGLVQLYGPQNAEHKVFAGYKDLLPQLSAAGIKLSSVRLSLSGQWSAQTVSGLNILLGRNNLHARLSRVIAALPDLEAQYGMRMSYIDARYPNGVAVKARKKI